MKRLIQVLLFVCAAYGLNPAQAHDPRVNKPHVVLLISEQNIGGPQRAWWVSEIDLSVVESSAAQGLAEKGYNVVEPSEMSDILAGEKAFRMVDISDRSAVRLGRKVDADYIIRGKAVASAGPLVPDSQMRSFFAHVSAAVIRVRDRKVIAYLKTSGSSAHVDAVAGGVEAFEKCGKELVLKIDEALSKERK